MLSTMDILRAVDRIGPAGLDDLEAAALRPPDGDGFWVALDAAVDHGYLRCIVNRRGLAGGYRLTRRGQGALEASATGAGIAAA